MSAGTIVVVSVLSFAAGYIRAALAALGEDGNEALKGADGEGDVH